MGTLYLAYMLRMWTVGKGQAALWRASLEDPRTGEVHVFASLDALRDFLAQCVTATHPASSPNAQEATSQSNESE
jgi:hypothetical protein